MLGCYSCDTCDMCTSMFASRIVLFFFSMLQIFEYSNYSNSLMVEYSNGKIGIRPRPIEQYSL